MSAFNDYCLVCENLVNNCSAYCSDTCRQADQMNQYHHLSMVHESPLLSATTSAANAPHYFHIASSVAPATPRTSYDSEDDLMHDDFNLNAEHSYYYNPITTNSVPQSSPTLSALLNYRKWLDAAARS